MQRESIRFRPAAILTLLALCAVLSAVAFMIVGANGNWDFVLPFRGRKLIALAVVAYAIAVSTVLFQTVTENKILTPSIMGFDALFALIQTCLVFTMGTIRVSAIDPLLLFAFEASVMTGFCVLLYRWLFLGASRSLHLLLLVGIVFGVLFRSLSTFLQRIIDPNEFVVLQDRLFASFNMVDTRLISLALIVAIIASLIGWRMRSIFDVLALGRDITINLGVDYKSAVNVILILVAVLVSISTALVGPVTFFGLLVANVAYQIMPTHRHVWLLPASALIAIICLIGGQVVVEHVFGFDTALSIIIEFVGGLVFILLVLKGASR